MAEIIRSFGYDDTTGLPVMMIRKKTPLLKSFQLEKKTPLSFCIPLDDAWRYSQKHNRNGGVTFDHLGNVVHMQNFIQVMWDACSMIHNLFDLGELTKPKMAKIASFIEDGLDELVKMPPQPKKLVEVGEYEIITQARNAKGEVEGKTVITRPLIIKEPLL